MRLSRNSRMLILLVALAAVCGKFMIRDTVSNLTVCTNNLKNIGTAMEMYSCDWEGHYPPRFEMLIPKYIEEIPRCPAAGFVTYQMELGPESPHNERKFQDYYFLYCAGDFHKRQELPVNYPVYDGVTSVCER